jgi:hypothetical protein
MKSINCRFWEIQHFIAAVAVKFRVFKKVCVIGITLIDLEQSMRFDDVFTLQERPKHQRVRPNGDVADP